MPHHKTPSASSQSRFLQSFRRVFKIKPRNQEELLTLLHNAAAAQIITPDTLRMIEGALKISTMQVRDIMIPATQIVFLDHDMPKEQWIPIVIDSGHSRIPVTGENRDEILGVVFAKDLIPYLFKNKKEEEWDLKKLLRRVMIVPESKRLHILLKEFRAKRQHLTMVTNEYGNISGLLTIEDVLEEIVGDIEDEFDRDEEDYIHALPNQTYIVQALTPIDDFNRYFETSLAIHEFDTIGGLVINAFGRLPKPNESITLEHLEMKIISADSRRIRLIQIRKPSQSPALVHNGLAE
jgi:magnesium and cobalt transporter